MINIAGGLRRIRRTYANRIGDVSRLVFVTGLSGAGMSSVIDHMEDMGFEVFDNLPLSLVEPLLLQEESKNKSIAIVIDSRSRNFSTTEFVALSERDNAEILYITCDDFVLQKRYTETRRRHPLAKDRPVIEGIRKERELLEPIRRNSDIVIDTTDLSIHDLKRTLKGYYPDNSNLGLMVTIMSFGYKNGIPREADIVMDVRFLKNPHWDEALRPMTGKDKDVGKYISSDKDYKSFIKSLKNTLSIALGGYSHEGKNYLTIAIGCTGGRHRSVFIAEQLKEWLDKEKYQTYIIHRDCDKVVS